MDNNEKIKICHVVSSLGVGGGEVQLLNVLKHTDKSKLENALISIGNNQALFKEYVDIGIQPRIIGKKPGRFDLVNASIKLRDEIVKIQPDIVHIQGFNAGWRTRLVILSIRPRPIVCYTEHGLNPWKKGLSLFVDRFLSQFTDAFISVSKSSSTLRFIREKYPKESSYLIYNGIDISEFDIPTSKLRLRKELGLPKDKFIIICIARLEPVKNILIFVELMKLLNPEEFHLVIVGDGSLKDEFNVKLVESKLESCISLLGFRRDIPQLLKSSDIFCLPSLREDFPLTILEAMACKLPVIATDVGGVSEIIENGKTGFLVNPDNQIAKEISLIVHELRNNSILLEKIGKNGRNIVLNKFSIENQVTSLSNLYKNLMRKK